MYIEICETLRIWSTNLHFFHSKYVLKKTLLLHFLPLLERQLSIKLLGSEPAIRESTTVVNSAKTCKRAYKRKANCVMIVTERRERANFPFFSGIRSTRAGES